MKVLFFYLDTPEIIMPTQPLGLVSVATAAKVQGHEVRLVALPDGADHRRLTAAAIRQMRPDAVGISVRNIDDQTMQPCRFLLEPLKDIVAACRETSTAPVILGGAGYSMYPETLLRYLNADIGIRGDGEQALPAVLDLLRLKMDAAGIKGVYLPGKTPFIKNCASARLDNLPLPDPSLWLCPEAQRPDIWMPFQTRRGCPLGCSYCSTASIEGTTTRQRSVKSIAGNIALHVEAGFRRFYCVDNTFNLPAEYARRLCREFIDARLGISWSCIVYPYKVDKELARDMAEAGCAEVSLGFESGSEPVLRSMRKRYSLDDVRKAAMLFKGCGIRQNGYLLLGGPGETRKTLMESLHFADSLPLDAMKVTVGIRIYPHTELARIAAAEGAIKPDDDLLLPRFYLAEGLNGWAEETVRDFIAARPHWRR